MDGAGIAIVAFEHPRLGRWRSGREGRPYGRDIAGRAAGPGLVLCSSVAIQASAAVSVGVFGRVGALGTSGLRFSLAALILLVIARPRLRGRTLRGWVVIFGFGLAMALMNVALYQALDRIPLGTAVTIEFLGPFLIAVAGARRRREVVWVLLAAGGVVALSDPSMVSWFGVGFAAIAAAAWAGYVLGNRAVGEQSTGFGGLALSVTVAALLTLPFTAAAASRVSIGNVLSLAVSGALGVALAYTLEMQAIRRTSAKTVSVLFSLDPAIAALAGALVLGQRLDALSIAGLVCVVSAGIGAAVDAPTPAK